MPCQSTSAGNRPQAPTCGAHKWGGKTYFHPFVPPINICAPMSWHVAVSGRRLGKETSWTWTLDRPTALTTYSQSWSCWWDYSGSEGFTAAFPGQSSSVIDHRLLDLVASIQITIQTETSVTSTSINLLLFVSKSLDTTRVPFQNDYIYKNRRRRGFLNRCRRQS